MRFSDTETNKKQLKNNPTNLVHNFCHLNTLNLSFKYFILKIDQIFINYEHFNYS